MIRHDPAYDVFPDVQLREQIILSEAGSYDVDALSESSRMAQQRARAQQWAPRLGQIVSDRELGGWRELSSQISRRDGFYQLRRSPSVQP